VHEFGTVEYELDRAVERLICVTTILRNWSFYEPNHPYLSDELVIKFLCTVIRYLGTRNMLLRSHVNTLDFMKDSIVFLSNLAQAVEIPGKEEALCLLHFLLAFAPCPPPVNSMSDKIIFSPYEPAVHRYLPPAVDSLAKLLARDEPNRTFYKILFGSEGSSSPPFELLTKTFALAISPIPGQKLNEQRGTFMKIVDARKPHLMQGLLAAEILSNLVPGHETNLARGWLKSEDGFAQSLLRLIIILSAEPPPPPPAPVRGAPQHRGGEDDSLLHIILNGITILRRLAEKTKNPDDPNSKVPLDGMIKKQDILSALMLKQARPEVVRQLSLYAALEQ
jgi:SWI/SNF chromatin-remodeling complex subunit SWI1